ncbi:ferritin subunit [Dendroctonus ponderosae]|uniref:Ferritin n=1 Tax=Dendroctonus ponderosae TaxID=77166 RepID=J3JWN8_DENPD
MRAFIVSATLLFIVACVQAELQCEHKQADLPQSWIDMQAPCMKAVRSHVAEELKAGLQYMAMGAHFSKDLVNRPGFASLFFKAASEEREHAIKLIEYLLMRGQLISGVTDMIPYKDLTFNLTSTFTNGASALRAALNLEASVTGRIRNLIQVCEGDPNFNDYHLVDYLTGDFLTEQYQGQRDLAGKLSSLEKMMDKHGVLGEFLFDKKLA